MFYVGPKNLAELLRRVTQQEVFEHYLGVSVSLGKTFRNPLRRDSNPGCYFYMRGGKLFMRDWAWGIPPVDCVGLVMHHYGLSYREAIRKISIDLEVGIRDELPVHIMDVIQGPGPGKADIGITAQDMPQSQKDWLMSFGISQQTCKAFRIYSPRHVWLGGKIIYTWNKDDPALAYYFGKKTGTGQQKWKIYWPNRRGTGMPRFICNTNRLNGWIQIPQQGQLLIITKSMKDVCVLHELGIPAVSMQGESIMPYDYIISELDSRFDHIISLYDFDPAGVRMAQKLRKTYGIQPVFLTNGRFGTTDMQAKDVSDLWKNKGSEATLKFINELQRFALATPPRRSKTDLSLHFDSEN
jgi:hypothetical protein